MKLLKKGLSLFKKGLSPAVDRGNWLTVFESDTGAWQQDVTISADSALAYSAVYSCVTLIASDIGKIPLRMVKYDAKDDIWVADKSRADIVRLIARPNNYQNRKQFIEQWLLSKLSRGNAYILKVRGANRVISALYVLDPSLVTPLVSDDGSVFYELRRDNLSAVQKDIIVPASEIIHDTMTPLFHPLCGTSPIFACGAAALGGLNIQKNSAKFFGNMSRPSGMLVAPGQISEDSAKKIKEKWEENYSGSGAGGTAVLGEGLKYEAMTISAVDSQLIEQLKWTAQDVCSCFHVPSYKVGFGTTPTYANAEILNQIYYSDCLQSLIESVELVLDAGLELPAATGGDLGVEFEIDELLKMDTKTRYDSYKTGIDGGWMHPNHARRKEGLRPVAGGDTPYMQQQNYSLQALNARDEAAPAPSEKKEKTKIEEKPQESDEIDKQNDEKTLGEQRIKMIASLRERLAV